MSYYGSADYRYNDDLALRMRDIRKATSTSAGSRPGPARKFNAENRSAASPTWT